MSVPSCRVCRVEFFESYFNYGTRSNRNDKVVVLPPAVQVHSHSCSLSRFLITISSHYKIGTRHSEFRLARPNIHTTTTNREDTVPAFSLFHLHIIDTATNQLRDLPHRRCQACTYLTFFQAIRRGDGGVLRVFCYSWSAKPVDVWLSYDQYSRPETTPPVADRSVIV